METKLLLDTLSKAIRSEQNLALKILLVESKDKIESLQELVECLEENYSPYK